MKIVRDAEIKGYVDERGVIKTLETVLDPSANIRGLLAITCEPGAVRAEHYHRKDTHWAYLSYGHMIYQECPMNDDGTPDVSRMVTTELGPGDMVFTPAMNWHKMTFPEKSHFIAFTTEPRDQKNYEGDIVRLKLI